MQQVYFIEFGMGVDLQGQDPTKAAIKAVKDAIGHNYLPGVRVLTGGDPTRMKVHVRLAAPPEAGPIDQAKVIASLPHGVATVEVVAGGMLTMGGGLKEGKDDVIVVVNAAVEVGI